MKFRPIVAFALVCAPLTSGHANPFNFQQGTGRVILNGFYTASPKQFDNHGNVYNAPNYSQYNVYAVGEYGLTDKLNLLATPSFRAITVDGDDNNSVGLGYTDLGARYEVAKGSNWVFDLQGLVRIPGTGRSVGVAQIGNNDTQYDLRALGGYTFGKSFVTLETSYRLRSGRPPNEFHADVTFGTHPTPKLLLLASVYSTVSDGKGSDRPLDNGDGTTFSYNYKYRYYDAFASAVYSITPRFAVQAGATATIGGRNALRQRGPQIGFWYNF